MILVWLLKPLLAMAQGIVSVLPKADNIAELISFGSPMGRLLGWVTKLNECVPVAEGVIGFGLLLGVSVVLYGVMGVRRTFSLFWPGAGS